MASERYLQEGMNTEKNEQNTHEQSILGSATFY